MFRKIKDLLRLNALSEQEIAIYIALLKSKQATIPQIREATKLANITVYRRMNELQERGMVQATAINAKQSLYRPLSLSALIDRVSKAQRKLRRMELELKNLDALLPHMNIDDETNDDIELRTGLDAFREEYLKLPDLFQDEYLHIGNTEKFWETAKLNYESPEERSFIHRRLARNIYGRVLDPYSPTAEMIQKNDSREKRTMKIVDKLPIAKDMLMIAEKQVTHFVCDPENPRVVVIRNPDLVAAHHDQFERIWEGK